MSDGQSGALRPTADFAEDVRRGLEGKPKMLLARYFYDALGSQLFEAICLLPWYPITRAERRLLVRHAAEMVEGLGDVGAIVELGPGSGEKLDLVAQAAVARRRGAIAVHLVDISDKALALARANLQKHKDLVLHEHLATYEEGLAQAMAQRPARGSMLVLFLGSNIGNFDAREAEAQLRAIRRLLRPGDGLLLGTDLVRSGDELVLAYDDPLGVTAAFNKNILLRINTELGASFDLTSFHHRAVWNQAASRVEMHLESDRDQVVPIPGAGIEVAFTAGERIWTESSHKYTPDGIAELAWRANLVCQEQWIDGEGRFSTTLLVAGR